MMSEWETPKTDWSPAVQEGVDADDFNRIEGNTLWLKENLDVQAAVSDAIIRTNGVDCSTLSQQAIFDRTGQSVTLSFSANNLPFISTSTGALTIYLGTGIPDIVRPRNNTGNELVRIDNWTIPGSPVQKDVFTIAELVVLSTVDDTWEGAINFYKQQQDLEAFVVDAISETSFITSFIIDYRSPF
jgi:hypothetical protein